MHSMALKINVGEDDRARINDLIEKASYPRQKIKYHCTIGFIEKMIPEDESMAFGQSMTRELQAYVDSHSLAFEVEKAEFLFRHVIVFLPTKKSLLSLQEMNRWLFAKVKETSGDRWGLNKQTIPENYIPHMTVWRTFRSDHRLKKLQELTKDHPSYSLLEAGFVLF